MGAAAAAFSLLAACAERGVVMYADPRPDASIEVMYVATQRALGKANDTFGEKRNATLNHFRAEISVPPNHEVGQIEWPRGTPDASRHFVITQSSLLPDSAQMARQIAAERRTGDTMIFVHGYNNTLSEAMYRFAQIKTDYGVTGPGVLFSWQSAGNPRGYIYDRDSVLFARDDLVETIRQVARHSDERVFLLAHSMGAQLMMEALRQIALTGDLALLDRVATVALISPDIDPDLFRDQVTTVGTLRAPILVFVSREDWALGLASLITGSKERLGVISSGAQVEGLDVRVIDVSGLEDGKDMNHATAFTSAAAVGVLRGLIDEARGGRQPFPGYIALTGDNLKR
ncbi:alpha/beta fold hydrolase [Roseovarius sp. LXJ103]|nr:alpha/beta fold hydrolase [Roseovarius carneus]PWE37237.1 hypothetical protein DD563_05340 [Pelagicola sp. LXJ1103]